MGSVWTLITAILGLAAFYVLFPVGLDAFRRYRKKLVLPCPEAAGHAEVGVDALRAALGSVVGRRRVLRIRECSLWPERKDCAQTCLRAMAEEGLPVGSPIGRG